MPRRQRELETAQRLAEAEHAARTGASRYCMVLSGRGPTLAGTRRLADVVRRTSRLILTDELTELIGPADGPAWHRAL